jgi:hypothetical protein
MLDMLRDLIKEPPTIQIVLSLIAGIVGWICLKSVTGFFFGAVAFPGALGLITVFYYLTIEDIRKGAYNGP